MDTRSSGGPIGGGGQRNFTIVGGACGVPSAAVAASLNVTTVDQSTNGDFRIFPAGSAVPLVSTQNWLPTTGAIANAAVVPLGTGGAITIEIDGTGSSNVIIDVNGYFAAGAIGTAELVASSVTVSKLSTRRWGASRVRPTSNSVASSWTL